MSSSVSPTRPPLRPLCYASLMLYIGAPSVRPALSLTAPHYARTKFLVARECEGERDG